MSYFNANWVRAWLHVCVKCGGQELKPDLVNVLKSFVLFKDKLVKRDSAEKVSKTFFEPEVIPPNHRCQISKPHVREFMQVDLVVAHLKNFRHFVWTDEHSVCERDCPYVFHGSDPELGAVDYVVLCKRHRALEELAVVVHALSKHSEHQVSVHVVLLGVSDKYAHWCRSVVPCVVNLLKVASKKNKSDRF